MNQQLDINSPDSIDLYSLNYLQNASALSSEEAIGTRVRYDYNTSETFYEIDVDDVNMTLYPEELFKDLLEDLTSFESNSYDARRIDEIHEMLADDSRIDHPQESNDVEDRIQTDDENLSFINSGSQETTLTRPCYEKISINTGSVRPITLFNSIKDVEPSSTQQQLKIRCPLEKTYRARYKSDYFPQSGQSRRPRYVADEKGNHFITLQMPAEYNHELEHAFLRIALVTIAIDGGEHYYSPYKFQTNHYDCRMPDENPIYMPVQPHLAENSTLKLQLVLIKSKLDKLSDAQPLKIFSDTIRDMKNIINDERLSPKDLINKYQLDKSHIVFTLCTKSSDGSYVVHPETTVISSVLTESSTKKSMKSTNETNIVPEERGTRICCPKCAYQFDLDSSKSIPQGKKRESKKSTPAKSAKQATHNGANKKRKTAQ